jgi:hypothetical protein
MQRESKEYWNELCRLAATVQDPKKLRELTLEINRLLQEKQSRLNSNKADQATAHRPRRTIM